MVKRPWRFLSDYLHTSIKYVTYTFFGIIKAYVGYFRVSPVASLELHFFHISKVVKKVSYTVHVKLLTGYAKGMKQYHGGKRPVSFSFIVLKIHNDENYSQLYC